MESNGESSSVRPRWTPKQEQLVILESIYNSGVVNPPTDETTRIRKLLEDYGPVVDANVFYWFQNRRSRSRRRSRQIQAKINREQVAHDQPPGSTQHQNSASFILPCGEQNFSSSVSFSCLGGDHFSSSSDPTVYDDNPIQYPSQVCHPGNERISGVSPFNNTYSAQTPNVHYQSGTGLITVYINGVATVVPMGSLDMKGMFGEQDLMLFHSSGIQVSNTSFSSSLQHGESYFLVPTPN
ncbi:Homeobox domain-containing protein [Heracleum sosnowskyi]|uniref:Protein WUSCHEL n=1 Tax=Heracleum sosnowskyi TaxID=360622 RepID=A0AAD8HES0_9APIA|nr:Homeobox domain-containing protein [Heracleum sosnowskyi]